MADYYVLTWIFWRWNEMLC